MDSEIKKIKIANRSLFFEAFMGGDFIKLHTSEARQVQGIAQINTSRSSAGSQGFKQLLKGTTSVFCGIATQKSTTPHCTGTHPTRIQNSKQAFHTSVLHNGGANP
jgi:hypothetical protein